MSTGADRSRPTGPTPFWKTDGLHEARAQSNSGIPGNALQKPLSAVATNAEWRRPGQPSPLRKRLAPDVARGQPLERQVTRGKGDAILIYNPETGEFEINKKRTKEKT